MRHLARLGLALLGLAVAFPLAANAGDAPARKTRHLCPNCQLMEAQRQAGNVPIVVEGPGPGPEAGCLACQAQNGMSAPVVVGDAPGYAQLGGSNPGLASLGGARVLSTDPMPIGVVQASYNNASPLPAAAAGMPRGPQMPGMAAMPPQGPAVPPAPTPWLPPRHRRPSVIAHLFGVDGFGRRGEVRAEQQAAMHAAIPVGQGPSRNVSELPANLVFGK